MGGYGSGCRYDRKATVEECRTLDAGRMQQEKVLQEDVYRVGSWVWSNADTGETTSSLGYYVNTLAGVPSLRLVYSIASTGEKLDYLVELTKTPLPWGGVRWGFRCPHCGRSCRKLHCPPLGKVYACRQCYRLTYKSAQDAHKLDRGFAVFMGMTPAEGRDWMKDLDKMEEQIRKRIARAKRKQEKLKA